MNITRKTLSDQKSESLLFSSNFIYIFIKLYGLPKTGILGVYLIFLMKDKNFNNLIMSEMVKKGGKIAKGN